MHDARATVHFLDSRLWWDDKTRCFRVVDVVVGRIVRGLAQRLFDNFMTHGSPPLSVGLANDHNGVAGTSNAVPSNLPAESWMTRLVNPVTRGDYGRGSKEGLLNILLHFSLLSLRFSLSPPGGKDDSFFFQKAFRERRGIIIVSGSFENMRVYIYRNVIEIGIREFGKIRLIVSLGKISKNDCF